jgi:hypothetical protein
LENEADSMPVVVAEIAPATPAAPATQMAPAVPAFDPRRRIRELLSIPDRDRTDAEWDELNELEIQTAPGNRSGNQPFAPYNPRPGGMAAKNRNNKGKGGGPRKPGGGGGKPFQGKPNNNKPRPA